jgi:tryptophanyl-tRNA synthetase
MIHIKSRLYNTNFKYLSGIKPTGELTIGNYLGVIKPAIEISKKENVLMFIADMHAFTVPNHTREVKKHTIELVKIFNMYDLSFFIQSHIPQHNQLGYIMEYIAKDWELRNQIQYKEKKGKDTRASLLTYPSLMAADCLLYKIENILVGEDQLTHIHLLNDLIESFEREFGENILSKPNAVVSSFPKIKDLKDPSKKMSKSNGDNGCIFLFDDPEVAYKKITSALTDSENELRFDPEEKPGVSNLLNIYSGLTDISIEEIISKYDYLPFPYGDFKKDLAMIVRDFLIDFQNRYSESSNKFDKNLEDTLKEMAENNLYEIMDAMGLKYEKGI